MSRAKNTNRVDWAIPTAALSALPAKYDLYEGSQLIRSNVALTLQDEDGNTITDIPDETVRPGIPAGDLILNFPMWGFCGRLDDRQFCGEPFFQ